MINQRVQKKVDLTTKQAGNGEINRVVKVDGNTRREDFIEVNNQVYKKRIIGVKNKKIQVFFKVQTELSIAELVKKQYEFCKENKIRVTIKVTIPEHIKRVGLFIRINNKISSAKWYKKQIEDLIVIQDRTIEVRKEQVYQKNYKSKYPVVYLILLQSKKVDHILIEIVFWNGNNINISLLKKQMQMSSQDYYIPIT